MLRYGVNGTLEKTFMNYELVKTIRFLENTTYS